MSIVRPWQGAGDATPRWRRFCWMVLIAYRVLRPFLGLERAIGKLQEVLSRQFREDTRLYMKDRFGIRLEAPDEAFDSIARNYKTRGEHLFGSGRIYIQVVQDSDRSFTHITKCLFNDFFRAHGAPELTAVFCHLDSIWIDELHRPQYKVRFERPTTLAKGGDACRFQFSRTSVSSEEDARPGAAGDGPRQHAQGAMRCLQP